MSSGSEQARYELDLLIIEAWQRGDTLDDIIFDVGAKAMASGIELDDAEQIIKQQYDLCNARQTTEQAIARLATLSTTRYERLREPEAKRLGMRLSVLDAQVEKGRPKADASEEQEALAPPAPQPWPEPVEAIPLLNELRAFLQRFIVVSEHALTTIVLWIAFTYFFAIAETSPRLAILSPTKRCGKTRLLEILLLLCPRAISASSLSPSAIFRLIDLEHPTLIIDEADTINANKNDELRGILNSGHTPAHAFVIRNVPVGDKKWAPHRFSTWAPIAMAAIGKLPETWLDRSVVVRIQRKPLAAKVERLTRRNTQAREDAAALASKLARLAADNLETIRVANPAMPDLASDRAIDNWEHLCGIADLGGKEWAAKARAAALALAGEADADTDSIGELLLADLNELFEQAAADHLASTYIVEKLAEREERPWPEYGRAHKPITQKQLASLLWRFKIGPPTTLGGTVKGYKRQWFDDAFARYARSKKATNESIPPNSSRPNVQTAGGERESEDSASVGPDVSDGSKNGNYPNAEKDLDDWTDRNRKVKDSTGPSLPDLDAERFVFDGGIPFVITREMKRRLRERGYGDEQIAQLTPAEAHEILSKSDGR